MKILKMTIFGFILVLSSNHLLHAGYHCDEWNKDKEACLKCNGKVCSSHKDCTMRCICHCCENSRGCIEGCSTYCMFDSEN